MIWLCGLLLCVRVLSWCCVFVSWFSVVVFSVRSSRCVLVVRFGVVLSLGVFVLRFGVVL